METIENPNEQTFPPTRKGLDQTSFEMYYKIVLSKEPPDWNSLDKDTQYRWTELAVVLSIQFNKNQNKP